MARREHTIYIGLGTNLGDRVAQLRDAVRRLKTRIAIKRVSRLYAAAPPGFIPQSAFVNAVVSGKTMLPPEDLLMVLQQIEIEMGRRPGVQYGPRPIDLDLLLYDALEYESPQLTLPHPLLHERAFVLIPLAEIAPTVRHPVLFYTPDEMLRGCPDRANVQLYSE